MKCKIVDLKVVFKDILNVLLSDLADLAINRVVSPIHNFTRELVSSRKNKISMFFF